jgi:hypothetical protein
MNALLFYERYHAVVLTMQAEMHSGAAIPSLVRFNEALLSLTEDNWQPRLKPVLAELCYNLESFNPAFAAVLLTVQRTIGNSDYKRRDAALKQLIVPLAGEYGMHNSEPQGMLLLLDLVPMYNSTQCCREKAICNSCGDSRALHGLRSAVLTCIHG